MQARLDIALINPPPKRFIEEYDTPSYGHLGLAYLASASIAKGFRCVVVDCKLERLSVDEAINRVKKLGPRVVGITSFTHEIVVASEIGARLKMVLPSSAVIIGGAHASCLPAETMNNFRNFDYLIKGEGEKVFPELVEHILSGNNNKIDRLKGIAFRESGKVRINNANEWIEDLDSLPFPAWDLYPKMKHFHVLSSRGCPFKCVFCAHLSGNKIRARSPENVISELEMLVDRYGAHDVSFCDETFGFKMDWIKKFSDLMVSKNLSNKIKWSITTRAKLINEEFLHYLKRGGCVKIDFGVESGNEHILKAIKKGEKKEDFIKAAKLIKRFGITSHSYYIIGHPFETKNTALDTISFATRLNTDIISIGIMIPYPGTEVAELASKGEGGYRKLSMDWANYNKQLGSALELENLSRRELTRFQLFGYLKFYIYNLKLLTFFKMMWKYRKLAFAIFVKFLRMK